MRCSVISGIRMATKGYIDPEMEKFNNQSAEEAAQWEALEKLVDSLNSELAEKILVCATEIKAAVDVNAFADGFRMAFRLMMESLDSRGTEEGRKST